MVSVNGYHNAEGETFMLDGCHSERRWRTGNALCDEKEKKGHESAKDEFE